MIALSLLVLACTDNPDAEDPTSDPQADYDPTVVGPHAVGTLEDALVGRTGVELAAQVWFPAVEEDDGTARRYLYDDILEGSALDTSTPACDAPLPVVVFSHGSGAIRFQSIFFTERLASHGWLVVAPDHTGNTFFDDSLNIGEMVLRRPADVSDTYDWLLGRVADPDDALYGCANPDAGFAMTGHSFGAWTTLAITGATIAVEAAEQACGEVDASVCDTLETWKAEHPGEELIDLSDPRAWAGVPMTPAGASLFADGLAEIAGPTLVFGGTLDTVTPYDTESVPIYEGLGASTRGLAGVTDAGHLSFSNICDLYPVADECGDGYLPVEDVQRIVNETAVPFLELARGQSAAAEYLPPDEAALIWSWEEP